MGDLPNKERKIISMSTLKQKGAMSICHSSIETKTIFFMPYSKYIKMLYICQFSLRDGLSL